MATASLARPLLAPLLALLVGTLLPGSASAEPSLREIVGQLVIIGFAGVGPSDAGVVRARRDIEAGRISGVIFYGHNIQSKAQVRELTQFFKDTRAAQPPFLAIEEEGGSLDRVGGKPGFSANYPSAASIALLQPDQAAQTYQVMARDLSEAGLNLNLAPVVDLNINPNNPAIGKMQRSYGRASELVEQYAGAFVRAHRAFGVLTAPKYWPGTGSGRGDPHKEIVDVTKTWKRQLEPQPFASLIDEQLADMVMVGHVYHSEWGEGDIRPASLSSTAITQMLRGNVGYDGVVITDDLQMRGVGAATGRSIGRAILQALQAGNDIVLIGNIVVYQADVGELVYKTIETAVSRGEIDKAILLQSYSRVIALKTALRPPR